MGGKYNEMPTDFSFLNCTRRAQKNKMYKTAINAHITDY